MKPNFCHDSFRKLSLEMHSWGAGWTRDDLHRFSAKCRRRLPAYHFHEESVASVFIDVVDGADGNARARRELLLEGKNP